MPRLLCSLGFLLFLPLFALPVAAQTTAEPASHAAAVAPFIDEHTLAIGHVDLKRLDVTAAVKMIGEAIPDKSADVAQKLAAMEQQGKAILTALAGAGMKDVYVVVSLSDVPQGPPLVVAPLRAGADAAVATGILKQVTTLPECEVIGGAAVAGSKEALARLKTLKPTARPELARAFERAGDSTAQLIFWPSEDTRRVLREMLPRLPEELGGGSGKMLADGIQWGAIWADAPPTLKLTALVQSKDADSAAALRGMIVSALQHIGKQEQVKKEWPEFSDLAALLTPRINNDQLLLNLSDREGAPQAIKLLVRPLQTARVAAGRSQSANNLKQIALAMHNFHDVNSHFPPQAIRSKEGKPLLSWRVAILPYLDQAALYQQFHLDEPWDSEHNRKLIEKMPRELASPHLGDTLIAKGMTSYLAPLMKEPAAVAVVAKDDPRKPVVNGKNEAIFDLPQGTMIHRIMDGTSNTVLVLETHPKSAVIWTKPEDLVIDERTPFAALTGQPNDGFNAVLADGSVRFLKTTIDSKTFLNLLQMNDGNAIGEF